MHYKLREDLGLPRVFLGLLLGPAGGSSRAIHGQKRRGVRSAPGTAEKRIEVVPPLLAPIIGLGREASKPPPQRLVRATGATPASPLSCGSTRGSPVQRPALLVADYKGTLPLSRANGDAEGTQMSLRSQLDPWPASGRGRTAASGAGSVGSSTS